MLAVVVTTVTTSPQKVHTVHLSRERITLRDLEPKLSQMSHLVSDHPELVISFANNSKDLQLLAWCIRAMLSGAMPCNNEVSASPFAPFCFLSVVVTHKTTSVLVLVVDTTTKHSVCQMSMLVPAMPNVNAGPSKVVFCRDSFVQMCHWRE